MKTSHILLSLSIAIAAGNCTNVVTPSNPTVLMPLQRGNMWIGRTPSGSGRYKFDTLEITGDTMVTGQHWFTARTSWRTLLLVANRPEGFVTAITQWNGGIHIELTIHFPAKLDDRLVDGGLFETSYGNYQSAGRIRHVLIVTASDTVITVPAGTFRCLELKSLTIPVDSAALKFHPWILRMKEEGGRAYIAPGIGIVKKVGPFMLPLPFGYGYVWELVEARM
jgi:hypothetical protein